MTNRMSLGDAIVWVRAIGRFVIIACVVAFVVGLIGYGLYLLNAPYQFFSALVIALSIGIGALPFFSAGWRALSAAIYVSVFAIYGLIYPLAFAGSASWSLVDLVGVFFGVLDSISSVIGMALGDELRAWLRNASPSSPDPFLIKLQIASLFFFLMYVGFLFLVELAVRFLIRALNLKGARATGGREREALVQRVMSAPTVKWLMFTLWLLMALAIFFLPSLAAKAQEYFKTDPAAQNIGTYYQMVLWAGPLLLFGELFAAGLNRETEGTLIATLLSQHRKRNAGNAQELFDWFKDEFSDGPIIFAEDTTPEPDGRPNSSDRPDVKDRSWVDGVIEERKGRGLNTSEGLKISLAKIDDVLQKTTAEPRGMIIRDELSEQKLDILAAMLREYRSKGMSLLVLSSRHRLPVIVEHFREAESRINSALASHWRRFGDASTWSAHDAVIYSTLEELDTERFRESGTNYASFLANLGAIFVLDVHTMDFTLLTEKINLLDNIAKGTGTGNGGSMICVQGAPMNNFRVGIGGLLPGSYTFIDSLQSERSDAHVALLEPSLETKAAFHKGLEAFNQRDDMPLISGPLHFLHEEKAEVTVFDPMDFEDKQDWDKLSTILQTPIGITKISSDYPDVELEAEGSEKTKVILARDDGNIAKLYSADVRGNSDDAKIIVGLSENLPYNRLVLARLKKNYENENRTENRELERFLPRVPANPTGLQDTLRYLSARFLAAQGTKLPESEVRKTLQELSGTSEHNRLRDVGTGRMEDEPRNFEISPTADALNDWFNRVFFVDPRFTDLRTAHHKKFIVPNAPDKLRGIVNRPTIFAKTPVGEDSFAFPKSDEGLAFAEGTVMHFGNSRYRFKRGSTGRGRGEYTLDTTDEGKITLDAPIREVFSRIYDVRRIELLEAADQVARCPHALFYGTISRETTQRFRRVQNRWRFQERYPEAPSNKWFAAGGVIRIQIDPEADPQACSLALGLALSAVLQQKFEAVHHRMAILLPQVDILSDHTGDKLFPPEIGRARFGEGVLASLNDAMVDPSTPVEEDSYAELIVLEEATHSLGVLFALFDAIRSPGIDLMVVWKQLIAQCAEEARDGFDPFGIDPEAKVQPDYAAAAAAMKLIE